MEGIIVKGVGGLYYVKTELETIKCKAKGKFRYNKLTPMVGDKVELSRKQDEYIIENIKERTNSLIRPFVSNITQAFIIVTLKNPEISSNLLNSFLVLAQSKNINIVVCFNKIDLISEEEIKSNKIIKMIQESGYDYMFVCGKTEEGIDKLKNKVNSKESISVFCGPSGVGKSTLLNKIMGKEIMETGDISKKLKRGKHTTRHCQLIQCEEGYIVDTPGFSSLDVGNIKKDELKDLFPEFHEYYGECKFLDCMHYKEPECMIKKQVEEGKLNKDRYEFYINVLQQLINKNKY